MRKAQPAKPMMLLHFMDEKDTVTRAGPPGQPAGDGGTQPNVQPALAAGLEARTSLPAPFRHTLGVHRDSEHPSTQSLLRVWALVAIPTLFNG